MSASVCVTRACPGSSSAAPTAHSSASCDARTLEASSERGDRFMSGSSVPLSIALTAGGLAVVNPCAFPLLPAFLSFYLGADEQRLPAAKTRALQGLTTSCRPSCAAHRGTRSLDAGASV